VAVSVDPGEQAATRDRWTSTTVRVDRALDGGGSLIVETPRRWHRLYVGGTARRRPLADRWRGTYVQGVYVRLWPYTWRGHRLWRVLGYSWRPRRPMIP
jgi:hypothetical protein